MKRALPRAALLGVLTVLLCLVGADGVLGLRSAWTVGGARVFPGQILFLAALVGLPPLFSRRTRWRDTLVNLPLCFLLYFPVRAFFGADSRHFFLDRGSALPAFDPASAAVLDALGTAALLWGVQSLVFFLCSGVRRLLRT